MFYKYAYKTITVVGGILQYACITHCTLEYIGDFVMCDGPSMEPTIHSNDILATEHVTPRLQMFKKGDIVIAKCPSNPKQHICKRLVGLPGDKIRNGLAVHIVPVGHVWLEGDSVNSTDSRLYGSVPLGLLRGRVVCKIWPLTDITVFSKKCVSPD